MFKLSALSFLIATLTLSVFSKSGPVIRKEIKEQNGRKVEYMYIDGIKVHEADPEEAAATQDRQAQALRRQGRQAPKGARFFLTAPRRPWNWVAGNGKPTKWKLVDGSLESVRGGGYLISKEQFGSCRLHVEFATPKVAKGSGQGRGNSGVFLMGQYEIQVL